MERASLRLPLLLLALGACTDTRDSPGVIVVVRDEPAGEQCAAGGQRIDIGADDGDSGGQAGDGILHAGEVESSSFVCNGESGDEGSVGMPGLASVTQVVAEPPGPACDAGGVRILAGLDDGHPGGIAADGILQSEEIDSEEVVCDASGAGASILTRQGVTPLGVCLHGGRRVEFGLDDGEGEGDAGDGILHDDEVDDTLDICRDVRVGRYYLLPVTFSLEFARTACEDVGMALADWSDSDDLDDMIELCQLGPEREPDIFEWICFTRYRVVGGASTSIYDESAMPSVPTEYWEVGYPAGIEGRPIVVRQRFGNFAEILNPGYPICVPPQ